MPRASCRTNTLAGPEDPITQLSGVHASYSSLLGSTRYLPWEGSKKPCWHVPSGLCRAFIEPRNFMSDLSDMLGPLKGEKEAANKPSTDGLADGAQTKSTTEA